ncbi:MAG TPA: phosphotransferase [Streptosporangiaceae bacterium]
MGRLLRRYHDVVAGYRPDPSVPFEEGPRDFRPGQIVGHGDIAPRNTVFRDGLPVAFIDWDGAWIADPLWDVGYAVWQFAPLVPDDTLRGLGWPGPPDRLAWAAALADGYGLDPAGRQALPGTTAPMIRLCAAEIAIKARAGQPAFARLMVAGVTADMAREARYAAAQAPVLSRALLAG